MQMSPQPPMWATSSTMPVRGLVPASAVASDSGSALMAAHISASALASDTSGRASSSRRLRGISCMKAIPPRSYTYPGHKFYTRNPLSCPGSVQLGSECTLSQRICAISYRRRKPCRTCAFLGVGTCPVGNYHKKSRLVSSSFRARTCLWDSSAALS